MFKKKKEMKFNELIKDACSLQTQKQNLKNIKIDLRRMLDTNQQSSTKI